MKVFAYNKLGFLYLLSENNVLISVELKYNIINIEIHFRGIYSCDSLAEAQSLFALVYKHKTTKTRA